MSRNDNYTNVMLEEIRDQNKAVLEIVGGMQAQMKLLATKEALQEVADDVRMLKIAMTDTNREVQNHEQRITALEQAA